MTEEYPEQEVRVLAALNGVELRRTSTGQTIHGQAVVYNALSGDLGGFVEKIAPGAFAQSLDTQDQLCLFNHDEGQILGRKSAGTLSLRDSAVALEFSCKLPDTSVGRDVAVLCERGDLKSMSFGFICMEDDWQQNGVQVVRTVRRAELFELSAVAFPAYEHSTVSLRSCPANIRDCLQPLAMDLEGEKRIDVLRIRRLFTARMRTP